MNIHRTILFAVALPLVLSSCIQHNIDRGISDHARTEAFQRALAPPAPQELTQDVAIPALGVTIKFDGTHGWSELKNRTSAVAFFKPIDLEAAHTAAIQIYPIFPPRTHFDNLDDFFNYTKPDLEKLRDKNGNDIVFEISSNNLKAPLCVLFHRKTRVKDERNYPRRPLIGDAYEYVCKHPYRPKVFVNIHYSERFAADINISDIKTRADQMLERILFTE